jgi:hypothetical protein
MAKIEPRNLLVIGVDTVSVANSAKKAGYEIYAVDYFGDLDLQRVCSKYKSIIQQKNGESCGKIEEKFNPYTFLKMTKSLLKEIEIDAVLLSSGLDDHFDVLAELNDLVPILGSSPDVIKRVREKRMFFEELRRMRIPHPETVFVRDFKDAKIAAAEIGYPVVIKPSKGFGGVNIRIARNPSALEQIFNGLSLSRNEVLIQKFINGTPASVSLIASESAVRILTMNEQLLGLPYVFQREPFGYCGNIVPLRLTNTLLEKCKRITEMVGLRFGLKGSNGIDFVISKENIPYVMEVNPRFQGSLECVERVLRTNLVKMHVDACLNNVLPRIRNSPSLFCTRLILYAPKRVIAPDLTSFAEVRDIPLPGIIIEEGEPLCSIVTSGETYISSLNKAKKLAKEIYKMFYPA